jgi:hypothetical protein
LSEKPAKTEKAGKPSKKEISKHLFMRMLDTNMKVLLAKSFLFIIASKSLTILSPWFLKAVVDSMAVVGAMDFNKALMGVCLFGMSRVLSSSL